MTLHPPKPKWTTPVLRQEPRAKPARAPREATSWTLGSVFGDAIRKTRADQQRRAELNDMGFRPLGGA
jgi:hypothetical protein